MRLRVSYRVHPSTVSPAKPTVTDDLRRPAGEPPDDLVDRGPVETLAPSRTAIVLVGMVALAVAVLAGVGALNVDSGRTLDDDERFLEAGRHEVVVGPARLAAELPGDWVARDRCPRWLQLSDADDDATTLHLVWLDAVPLPSDAERVELVDTPDDLAAWWRQELDLEVSPLGTAQLDGRPVDRYALDETAASRRRDGLFACGEVGGLAATGMLGPAARFDQRVAVVDLGDTPLLLVAAAYTGGDLDRAVEGLQSILDTGTLDLSAAPAGSSRPAAGARRP